MIGASEYTAEARNGHPRDRVDRIKAAKGLVGMIRPTEIGAGVAPSHRNEKVARSRGLPSRHLSILLDVGRAPGTQPRQRSQFRATEGYLKVICRRWRSSATAEDARRGHQRAGSTVIFSPE
jgi:hypothetical protein